MDRREEEAGILREEPTVPDVDSEWHEVTPTKGSAELAIMMDGEFMTGEAEGEPWRQVSVLAWLPDM